MTSTHISILAITLLTISLPSIANENSIPPGMVKKNVGGFLVYQHPENLLVAKNDWIGIYDEEFTPPSFAMTRFKSGELSFESLSSAAKGQHLFNKINSIVFHYSVNCERRTFTQTKKYAYAGYFAEGKLIDSVPGDLNEVKWDQGLLGVTASNVCRDIQVRNSSDDRIFKLGFHFTPYIANLLNYNDKWVGNVNEKYEYFFMRSLPVTSLRPWVIYSMGRGKDLGGILGSEYSRYVSWGTQYEFDCKGMRARVLQQAMSTDYFLGGVVEKYPKPLPFNGDWVKFDNKGNVISKSQAYEAMFADEIKNNSKLACPIETMNKIEK